MGDYSIESDNGYSEGYASEPEVKEYECSHCGQDFARGELKSYGATQWLCEDCYNEVREAKLEDEQAEERWNHG